MATGNAFWGIDIGQCALKAMRCYVADDGHTVVADAFDFIEYPKILSQPEAEPEQLVKEAMQLFLSRNDLRGDKVAVSVSGQSGLARFIKLPPVDAKRIPDLVKFEAKQQIPFDLEDVIWDYQQMPGSSEEEGFALETEVGLFAMKREQVFKSIKPYTDASVELDVVQLAPISIYNFAAHDLLHEQMQGSYDPEDPSKFVVVLSLGTETTDLVVTNGYRMWQRNIPLGGNQFTRQLTKELKLTFAKAEHLKRNARESEDPKKIFQAMRPTFNELVTQIQRSIGFFNTVDRKAEISHIVALGNAMKLPGLSQYLEKNLGMKVVAADNFTQLAGPAVLNAPTFRDNILSFNVCYGLCLQGLAQGKMGTNLLPREILVDRMIRRKKPWAVAALGVLVLGMAMSYMLTNRVWQSVHESRYKGATQAASSATGTKDQFVKQDGDLKLEADRLKALGDEVVGNAENRLLWLELLTAINAALPHTSDDPAEIPEVKEVPLDQRREIHIESVEAIQFADLKDWFSEEIKKKYEEGLTKEGEDPPTVEGPQGKGWVIEISAFHHFNPNVRNTGAEYVRNTFLKKLEEGSVLLPSGPGKTPLQTTFKDLGIGFPTLVSDKRVEQRYPNPDWSPTLAVEAGEQGNPEETVPKTIDVFEHRFTVQFCWTVKPATKRLEESELRRQEESKNQADPNEVAGGE